VAATNMLEIHHHPLSRRNIYDKSTSTFGEINKRSVVIARMAPCQPGKLLGYDLACSAKETFPNITVQSFVGVSGGVSQNPSSEAARQDVNVYDVVIGWAEETGAPFVDNRPSNSTDCRA